MTELASRCAEDSTIRVVLVDDHLMLRTAVKSYLESMATGIQVVAETDNGEDAVSLAREHRPDVCIMDVHILGMSSFDATRQILKERIETKILAVSGSAEASYVAKMIDAGVSGYVLKNGSLDELCKAIAAVKAGRTHFSLSVLPRERRSRRGNNQINLSLREREIIELVCQHYTEKEIANALCIGPKTVKEYKHRAMMKTGTHSTTELFEYAIRQGIVVLEEGSPARSKPMSMRW